MLPFVGAISLVLCLACSAAVLAYERQRVAEEALDGTWQADVSESQAIVLTIKGPDIAMTAVTGGQRLPVWVGKLRLSEDQPSQQMDWIELRSGNVRLPDNKCLFRRRGDLLLVIGGGPDKRPTKFLSGPGSEPKTLLFLRTSPE